MDLHSVFFFCASLISMHNRCEVLGQNFTFSINMTTLEWTFQGRNVNTLCFRWVYFLFWKIFFICITFVVSFCYKKKTEPNSEIVHWSALKFLVFKCAKNIVNTTLKLDRFSITWRMERGMCFFVHNNIRFQFVEDQQLHPKCKYQTHIFYS